VKDEYSKCPINLFDLALMQLIATIRYKFDDVYGHFLLVAYVKLTDLAIDLFAALF
jgi:hypothetical protein